MKRGAYVSTTVELPLAAMAREGCRLTGQRRRLAACILTMPGSFSAEEVCAAAPGVGRATVYRTLALLARVGAIEKTESPLGKARYMVVTPQNELQTQCTDCGETTTLDCTEVSFLVRRVKQELGGRLAHGSLTLYYRCELCEAQHRFLHRTTIAAGT